MSNTICFTHYQTGEVREVVVPTKLQQFNGQFIAAFMTSVEHCEELEWYRETCEKYYNEGKTELNTNNHQDITKYAFYKVRSAFVKKYFPEYAPKEKTPRKKKPAKLDMWKL